MSDEKQITISESQLEKLIAEKVKASGGIGMDALKEMLSAVVTAAKQPTVIEQQKIDAEMERIKRKNESRARVAGLVKRKIKNQRAIQATCSHEHSRGQTHCVYIMEKRGPGYLLCQKQQCIIRPGQAPHGYTGTDIYDTTLYNRLFQKLNSDSIFG